jgi:UDP:flavonoid glycosyltransferase YjiC (YdhE family)
VFRAGLLPRLSAATDLVLAQARAGADVLVGSTLAWPARIAREVLGIPLVVAHLAPSVIPSSLRAPLLPGTLLSPRAPAAWNRVQWLLIDAVTDRFVRGGLEAVRARHGLPPVRRVVHGWMNQADALLGLFPSWFGPPQADWPRDLVLTGFLRGDDAGAWPSDPSLEEWMEAGSAPIVFTAGSANVHGGGFYRESLAAADRLGRRALLVTRARRLLPERLPDWARHAEHPPFTRVLPRAAALVSHGGIGTCAAGLAAGVPQLARPLGFDQLDNASRLADLGAGAVLADRAYRAPRVAAALERLLDSASVATACASARARIAGEGHASTTAAELIERAARRVGAGKGPAVLRGPHGGG